VQAEPGQRRHRHCPTAPASSAHSPARGKTRGGPVQPHSAGSVRGVPARAGGAELRAQGKALPCPRSPVQGGSCPRCRQRQLRWDGQAASKQAAGAEAWPLLLLKGMGGGGLALRRWRAAGTQRAKPAPRAEVWRVPGVSGAGGRRATGWAQCWGAEHVSAQGRATLPRPAQPEQRQRRDPTRCPPWGTRVTPSSNSPPRAGDTTASAGPVSARAPTAIRHPSAGHRMDAGPREMVQDGRCRAGDGASRAVPGSPAWDQGMVPEVGSPGLLRCGRGTGAESGAPRPHLPQPCGAGQGGGRGRRAHQRALWSLMKAVLSPWASYSSPSDSEGPSSCQMSEGSPL